MDRALRRGEFAPAATTTDAATASSSPPQTPGVLTVWAYNQLIRRLGKADRLSDAFEVLDGMAALGVENNHETLEFATNAAVKSVEFETRAVSMKTLPSGEGARGGGGRGEAGGGGRGRGSTSCVCVCVGVCRCVCWWLVAPAWRVLSWCFVCVSVLSY